MIVSDIISDIVCNDNFCDLHVLSYYEIKSVLLFSETKEKNNKTSNKKKTTQIKHTETLKILFSTKCTVLFKYV